MALNNTNVVASSYTWEMVCEWKWLNATTGAEVYEVVPVPFPKEATVRAWRSYACVGWL